VDRDAVRIAVAGERCRIRAVVDERDLRRGERDDLGIGVVPIDGVEVMEVTPRGTHDQHTTRHARSFLDRV
jgi:hypothetical protein